MMKVLIGYFVVGLLFQLASPKKMLSKFNKLWQATDPWSVLKVFLVDIIVWPRDAYKLFKSWQAAWRSADSEDDKGDSVEKRDS